MASAVASAAALGTVLAGATGAEARTDEAFFTAEKYAAVAFGTSKADVWQQLGGPQSPKPGSSVGWCTDGGTYIQCFAKSDDYAPYGTFSFDKNGKLYSKHHEFLYEPKTPSITLAQFNQVKLGVTEAQLWSYVSPDSCVQSEEEYPNWPATTGHEVGYFCRQEPYVGGSNARFMLTDGAITAKYQYYLT
ncbi:BLIP family protein [Streptomyces sp. NPDC048717]|uniref:BLIP family protein n=1 Tax=Streptomyces sp. NPDC048717 TaxID=3154928 RepID=UPI0034303C05